MENLKLDISRRCAGRTENNSARGTWGGRNGVFLQRRYVPRREYMRAVAVGILMLLVNLAIAADRAAECGSHTFRVVDEAQRISHPFDHKYRLVVTGTDGDKPLYVANDGNWFNAICTKTKKGRPLLLYQTSCGGSGCPESIYGAIDPDTLKILLKPAGKENDKAASKILGYTAPYLPREKSTFCCAY